MMLMRFPVGIMKDRGSFGGLFVSVQGGRVSREEPRT